MSSIFSTIDDSQFQCRRVQTKVFAGPSKKSGNSTSTATITEEDIYAAKVQREFPKYVERKTDAITWRCLYEKRVQRKQKKQDEKLRRLTKAKSQPTTQAKQTMMIDVVHIPGRCQRIMTTTPSAMQISKVRKEATSGCTRIHRISPSTTVAASKVYVPSKKPTPLMSKCLKMAKNMRR